MKEKVNKTDERARKKLMKEQVNQTDERASK